MRTRINFGVHSAAESSLSVGDIAKFVGYNFLCAKRHFEHALASKPEVFQNGNWVATPSENVKGKKWHFFIGCIELVPLMGHIVAIAERIFGKNAPLPSISTKPLNQTEPHSVKSTSPSVIETPREDPSISDARSSNGSPSVSTEEEAKEEASVGKPACDPDQTAQDNQEGWFNPISDKPAESPFRKGVFDLLPDGLSSMEGLSDAESKALKSIQILTNLLGVIKPLSEYPKFPLKFNNPMDFLKLVSVGFMKTVPHPISFDFDGDGWPFVVIKVLNASDKSVEKPIFLFCGPHGSHRIYWDGWWEYHCGSSHPCFFSERQFIYISGELMRYPEEIIQRFKTLMANGEVEDDNHNKWVLAPPLHDDMLN